jgi:hypothetical protein
MLFSISSSAGPVGDASGFEDDDGNLAVNSTFDWNGFAPVTWTGTAPTRTSSKTVSGWDFTGLEDWQATTADSAFAGGTKQDDECATVNTGKAPNKDDLKRVYFSSKTVSGDVFLNLAWVRIPQNTTSPSAHIGFEFNQSETLCPAGSDGLVTRTAGDMLIVYDFEGGSTDTPTITLGRWLTDPSDPDQADFFTDPDSPCEVDSNSPPCWGDFVDLTDLGFAEGRVNTTTVGTVTDALTPPTPPATTSVSSTLGLNEFGEAGINLTDAGVFQPNECLAFGKSYAVSRSSGNSGTAQMKDLVGPGDVDLANCGRVIIRKVTDPSPDPTDTTFTYATTGGLVPPTFGLKNGEFFDYGPEVIAGAYSVTEDDPSADNFVLTDIDCSASETANGTTITENEGTRTVSFNLAAEDTVDCTFTNTLQTGAIEITKTRKHAATPDNDAHAGVEFTVDGTTVTTDANGEACVDGLVFGTYTVTESVPAGYVSDDPSKDVLVDNTATCEDDPYGGETVSFHNTPLTNVTVSVNSQIDGGTASTIVCTDADANESSASTGANGDGSLTVNDLLPTDPTVTLTCEITVDP